MCHITILCGLKDLGVLSWRTQKKLISLNVKARWGFGTMIDVEKITFTENVLGTSFQIHVVTNSSQSQIVSVDDGILRVKIRAKPQNNAANEEVIELLSNSLNVPKNYILITLGVKSKNKILLIKELNTLELKSKFNQF